MARFLSPEWFSDLESASGATPWPAEESWILEQMVTDAPGGEVRYQLVVANGSPRIRSADLSAPTVTFTSDYATAAAIARGDLSTHAALLDGRVRVSGNLSGMADALRHFSGVDLLPASVRVATTY